MIHSFMADNKEQEEKVFSIKEKRYYLRLGITIVTLVVGAVILYYAISPLQFCLSSNSYSENDITNRKRCHEYHPW